MDEANLAEAKAALKFRGVKVYTSSMCKYMYGMSMFCCQSPKEPKLLAEAEGKAVINFRSGSWLCLQFRQKSSPIPQLLFKMRALYEEEKNIYYGTNFTLKFSAQSEQLSPAGVMG